MPQHRPPSSYYPDTMPAFPVPPPPHIHPMPPFPESVILDDRHPAPRRIRRGSVNTASGSSSGTSLTEETIQESQMGMTAETKNLYREDPRFPWRELSPEDIGINLKAISASNKFALVVRREKRIGDTDDPAISLHSITIQSPLIKALLGPVFAGYHGINTSLKRLEFTAPFHEFFYRWTEFVKAKSRAESEAEIAHFGLLFDIISAEITPHIEQAGDLVKNGVMSFDYLWSLFEPGTEIYSRVDDQDRLYLLVASRYVPIGPGVKIFSLTCRFVDTNGIHFGFTTANLAISSFDNVKPISELNVLPSHLQSNMGEIRKKLHDRGKKFEQLKGFHHVCYTGYYNFLEVPFGGSRKRYVQRGRVIIDCGLFVRYNTHAQVHLAPLSGPPTSVHLDPLSSVLDMEDDDMAIASPAMQQMQQMARLNRRRFAGQPSSLQSSLSEDHYVLCNPTVKGFCLRAKKWVILYVDSITEIEWSSNAFKQLVLPHDYKRIVWAFVEAQISQQDTFDDLVRGKGKGFIMLLSGEPGTGKTLTAESVADAMQKPLYSMSAGELGNEADEVERNLQRVLELSTKWGAVLLIDECDVFMVKRSSSDLHRNQLVSVFLRLLEYYEGVMFLTTNRIESFDPAFESRIHLTINYPKLDHKSRLHIWRAFVDLAAEAGSLSELDEENMAKLAESELNGRQIKNVVKTARLLAAGDKVPLRLSHIETVMRVKRGDPAYLGQDAPETGMEH